MRAEMIGLSPAAVIGDSERIVSIHEGQSIDRRRFTTDVAAYASAFRQQGHRSFALYYESAYPFATMLFALWHAGKEVWVPGNNRPATADYLLGQGSFLLGEWLGREGKIEAKSGEFDALKPLDPMRSQMVIFTSGSSGEPKMIRKTLDQLQKEVEILELQWGAMIDSAAALSTVSQQHFYGLLFRLLWPLAAQRPFYSPMYLSPEPLLKAASAAPAYWVASPAQLKRLDELSDWNEIAGLKAIFSSGGPLPDDSARRIAMSGARPVVEIYGSSESGGIGWRRPPLEKTWQPFTGTRLVEQGGRCRLYSPLLGNEESCLLDDAVECHDDGRFTLNGRLDRIVKVEGKRLSLNEMEHVLLGLSWIKQCHCLLLAGAREQIAAIVVPVEGDRRVMEGQSRESAILGLREHLLLHFESVVVPKKWLFINELPMTAQAKINTALLLDLIQLDNRKFPHIWYCRMDGRRVELRFRVRRELVYFSGHFPETPILPGVAQLAWVSRYGKLFFDIALPFATMEVIKFKKIIRPDAIITMMLEWKASNGKLYFEVSSASESHSSGRMVYGAGP